VAMTVKLVPLVERSILNPLSLLLLSVQDRLTWLAATAVAVSDDGAAGRANAGVVAEAGTLAESPAALVAATWNQYEVLGDRPITEKDIALAGAVAMTVK